MGKNEPEAISSDSSLSLHLFLKEGKLIEPKVALDIIWLRLLPAWAVAFVIGEIIILIQLFKG